MQRAIETYLIDQAVRNEPLAFTLPAAEAQALEICRQGVTDPSCINLDVLVTSQAITALPTHSLVPTTSLGVGYTVYTTGSFVTVDLSPSLAQSLLGVVPEQDLLLSIVQESIDCAPGVTCSFDATLENVGTEAVTFVASNTSSPFLVNMVTGADNLTTGLMSCLGTISLQSGTYVASCQDTGGLVNFGLNLNTFGPSGLAFGPYYSGLYPTEITIQPGQSLALQLANAFTTSTEVQLTGPPDDIAANSTDSLMVSVSVCGDATVSSLEGCDDGATLNGDGCDELCAVEVGYSCTGAPSTCSTVCGDGMVYGSEQCDDGNTDDLDGCDASCQVEGH
jgi:cysteine-rich repeat protein